MKHIYFLKLCVCLSLGASSFAYADDIKVVMDEDGIDYRAIYTVMGEAKYPYPIKTDRLNQMMGVRLAVHQGFSKMMKTIKILKPYVDEVYQPHMDNGFLRGAYVGPSRRLENTVQVDLQYLFILNQEQWRKMKKHLSKKINLIELPKMAAELSKNEVGYEITKPYWDKLINFSHRMSDD